MLVSFRDLRCQTGHASAKVADGSTSTARPAWRTQHRDGRRGTGLGHLLTSVAGLHKSGTPPPPIGHHSELRDGHPLSVPYREAQCPTLATSPFAHWPWR